LLELVCRKRSVEVSRVDDGNLTSNLTETKRGEETTFESDMLDRLGGVEEIRESSELGRDVVGIVVSGDDGSGEGLEHTVELPSSSTTLGVTGERFLDNDGNGVTLGSAKLLELLVVDVRLVLVVGLGRGTVARDDADRVNVETPNGQSPSERSDVRVMTLEHTESRESLLFLSLRLVVDEADSSFEPLVAVCTLVCLELGLEQLVLVLEPLRDLSSSEGKLSGSIVDVEQERRLLE
jgi:hypothetical protein